MKKVIVFGATNSKKSINKQLAVYASKQLKDVEIQVLDLNDYDLPIYSIDREIEEGIHPEAIRFNNELQKADAFIISLAEHNGSYTAVFKNVYDWASRINQKVWNEKPTLLLSTSPGARGGATVLETAKGGFSYMGAKVVGSFSLPSFQNNFKDHKIVTEEYNEEVASLVAQLQKAL